MRSVRTRSWALIAALTLPLGCNQEREKLVGDLKNDRPEIRAGAVHRLGELKDPQDYASVLKLTTDSSSMVRKAAAESLGLLADPRGIDALGVLLGDPSDEVQAAAAVALSQLPGDKAHVYLLNAFARRGTVTRAAIGKALGPKAAEAVKREADGIWERASKALAEGAGAERVGAAEELGRSGRPEAVTHLSQLLGNDSILLAAGAARGLGFAGDAKAVPSLVAVLKQNDPQLREAVAQALGELGDPAAVAPLAAVAQGSEAAAPEAAAALARFPAGPDVNAALCQVVTQSEHTGAVAVAAKALQGRSACPLPPLAARLAKGGAPSKAAAVALGQLGAGDADVAAKLLALAEERDAKEPALRIAAIQALGAMGATSAGPALLKVVKAESDRLGRLREKWVKTPLPLAFSDTFAPLEEQKDPASVKERQEKLKNLLDRVHANNVAKAQAAGQQLKAEAPPADLPELIPDLEPHDTELLAAAAVSLGQVHAEGAQALLEPLAVDGEEDLRVAALTGLASLGTNPDALKRVQAGWGALGREATARVAEALKAAGPTAVPVLLAGLTARESDRVSILQTLVALNAVQAAEPIEKLLTAAGEEQEAAARALGTLGQPRSVKPLIELVKDPQSPALVAAATSLGQLKDPSAKEPLERLLFSDRPEVRAAALVALKLVSPQPEPMAAVLQQDYYRDVRRAAGPTP
jgi:HEAT repeat protein